jgi:hypothetical protein
MSIKSANRSVGENMPEVKPCRFDTLFKPGFRIQAEKVIVAWHGENTGAATIDVAFASSGLVAKIYRHEAAQ